MSSPTQEDAELSFSSTSSLTENNMSSIQPILTADVEFFQPSRNVLRNRRSWRDATVQLYPNANLIIKTKDNINFNYLILPAAIRRATPTERRSFSRPYILLIRVINHSHVDQLDASTRTIYLSFPTPSGKQLSNSWLESMAKQSLNRIATAAGIPLRPVHAPFFKAWGHLPTLPRKQITSVMKSLNFKMSKAQLEKEYKKIFNRDVADMVHCKEFIELMLHIAVNETVKVIAKTITNGEERPLTHKELAEVLLITEDEAKALLSKRQDLQCPLPTLTYLLYHPSNSCIEKTKANELHDMTRPLNEYLISSSHNTYLTGDQLKSKSSPDMYRYVLEQGCRCVEIDAWDGDDGVPHVYHGKTMTSTITLESVLKAIAENAFSHGYSYPVIVSLENHLSVEQQKVAAKQIREIFGDTLATPKTHGPIIDVLPSPTRLKNKIILKAKTGQCLLKKEYSDECSTQPDVSMEISDSDDDLPLSSLSLEEEATSQSKTARLKCFVRRSSNKKEDTKKPKEKIKVTPELAELVLMPGGSRKKLMELWTDGKSGAEDYLASICVSISEKKIIDVKEADIGDALTKYNEHALTRVYPKATRIDSSNYAPSLAHSYGCQIVAMNWQKVDTDLAMYLARFMTNNGCGYILNSSIREPDAPCVLRLTILSAFLLPSEDSIKKTKTDSIRKSTADSYCTVKVFDTEYEDPEDCISFTYSSGVARSDGFAPSWNETVDIKISNRSFAIIHFKLYDRDTTSDDDPIGYVALPLSLLREGIRSFPLNSMEGEPMEIPGTTLRPSLLCSSSWM